MELRVCGGGCGMNVGTTEAWRIVLAEAKYYVGYGM
jgi:hypothetical protein